MTLSLLCGAEVTSTVTLNLRCKLWRELLRLMRANFQMRWRLIALAGEHGLSVRAVRDHEKAGILPPAECSPHGYRAYAPRHIAALRTFLTRSRLTWPPTRIFVGRPPRPAWPSTWNGVSADPEKLMAAYTYQASPAGRGRAVAHRCSTTIAMLWLAITRG
ncbi:MerR family transcriptional regulator [Streptosporangium sandarakinum]|uniref:MerR family transcriptional regulator n=1 Tax=Streptosporangium sandarakinum TaxID=1260955 RepID=UPI00368345B0